ncbi:MAG: hypothetical protein R3E56_03125 [Burkholderiaceae bacterium]
MLERAAAVLQSRVVPEKRDAAIKGVQADAKKYMDKTVPMVNGRAVALAPKRWVRYSISGYRKRN